MKEIVGNLWDHDGVADAICITTNSIVRKDGACVMGRGCALEAKQRYPGIDYTLGFLIELHGNKPMVIRPGKGPTWICSFPVKHHWKAPAEPELIEASARLFVQTVDYMKWSNIVLPRPGCGNGQLSWDDVRSILEPILDDRFSIITFA